MRYVNNDSILAYLVSVRDSGNETKESLEDWMAAIMYSLPSETVMNFSDAKSDNISSEQ